MCLRRGVWHAPSSPMPWSFTNGIYGMHAEVKQLHLVCGPTVADPKGETLAAWTDILKINYWPIFAIVEQGHTGAHSRRQVLVDSAHDLTGRIFQRLIADRKYLATFYTLPASAALLARLAVAKMEGVDWSDAEAIRNLRIGDFACGTGALLSAVYEQIASRHERAGGDPAALHRVMMEEVLYGCDVMPSAIHITGSTLSGVEPSVGFGCSRLYTMPYGRQGDGTVALGSPELLQSSHVMSLFNTNDPALRTGSVGEETAANVNVDILDEGFDLVIMNPPFTRNTGQEGEHIGVADRAFAAFNATDQDQRDMGKRLTNLKLGTCYHGNAGIASAFAGLAHKKLKPGGVLALVLPLSATVGLSWQAFRQLIENEYADVGILSIAASDTEGLSFSADTGMAECLVVARKGRVRETQDRRLNFTSLHHRPQGFVHASSIAGSMFGASYTRRIEDGPYGGTALVVGSKSSGEMLSAGHETEGSSWNGVRLSKPARLSTARLALVGQMGIYHIDINGPLPRGPFDKLPASQTATYPSLWNHDAVSERRIVCEPDSQMRIRQGMESKAAVAWSTASRSHINRDFRFNSQPLTAAFTEQRSLGGRAWPNVIFQDSRFDYCLVVWLNSSLGLLSYWWHSNRQQNGRGITSVRAAETLTILDFRVLSDDQLQTTERIFEEFRDKELQPAYLADADPNRALLDRRVVCDLLGFDEDVYRGVRRLAAKWCAEPSVHGGKARPKSAKYVE